MPVASHRESSFAGTTRHERHRPEQTLLYQLIECHYPVFLETLAAQGHALPKYVRQEFEDYLKCGRMEHGFLRIRCEACHAEKLVAFSCKRRGFYSGHPALRPSGQPPAVQNRSRRFCARAAAPSAWWKAPRCWWMKYCRTCPCANGY